MTQLTPEQRLRAYEYALRGYTRDLAEGNALGICYYLTLFRIKVLGLSGLNGTSFPEMLRRKPENAGAFWFPLNEAGSRQRISLLSDCIEELKGLIRK